MKQTDTSRSLEKGCGIICGNSVYKDMNPHPCGEIVNGEQRFCSECLRFQEGIAEGRRLQKNEDDNEGLTEKQMEFACACNWDKGYSKALADVEKIIDDWDKNGYFYIISDTIMFIDSGKLKSSLQELGK